MPLHRPHRAVDVRDGLAFGDLAHQHVAVLGEADHGRGGPRALRVGDDGRLAALQDAHHRVGRFPRSIPTARAIAVSSYVPISYFMSPEAAGACPPTGPPRRRRRPCTAAAERAVASREVAAARCGAPAYCGWQPVHGGGRGLYGWKPVHGGGRGLRGGGRPRWRPRREAAPSGAVPAAVAPAPAWWRLRRAAGRRARRRGASGRHPRQERGSRLPRQGECGPCGASGGRAGRRRCVRTRRRPCRRFRHGLRGLRADQLSSGSPAPG